jgi:hypothetical protein
MKVRAKDISRIASNFLACLESNEVSTLEDLRRVRLNAFGVGMSGDGDVVCIARSRFGDERYGVRYHKIGAGTPVQVAFNPGSEIPQMVIVYCSEEIPEYKRVKDGKIDSYGNYSQFFEVRSKDLSDVFEKVRELT